MASIPMYSGKVSLDKLSHLPKLGWSDDTILQQETPAVYHFTEDGLRYDFLWKPQPGAKKLFVLLSGDALRDRNDPPVFQRWSWAEHFPGHCLYYSDPSLYLDASLGLAWYAGTEDFDVLAVIARHVTAVARSLGIAPKDIYSYGSSGGGFAAMRLLHFLPETGAIAVNPQTSICQYTPRTVEKYLNICFGKRDRAAALRDFPDRFNLLNSPGRLAGKRIVLAQNTVDEHHFQEHYKPFCKALGIPDTHDPEASDVRRILFSDEGGHKRAETAEVFGMIMDQIRQGKF